MSLVSFRKSSLFLLPWRRSTATYFHQSDCFFDRQQADDVWTSKFQVGGLEDPTDDDDLSVFDVQDPASKKRIVLIRSKKRVM